MKAREILAVGSLLITILVRDAAPTIVVPVSLFECVRKAGVIFVGTVSSIQAERHGTEIVTRVTFADVRSVAGRKAQEISMRLFGGTIGDETQLFGGLPALAKSTRYVVLAKEDLGSPSNGFLPFVYFNQGLFELRRESPSGPAVVHDHLGRPVLRLVHHHLVVVDARIRSVSPLQKRYLVPGEPEVEVVGPSEDDGSRLTEGEFVRVLGDLRRDALR